MTINREFSEQMKVYLTEEEKTEHSQSMAKAFQELNDLREQLKEAQADYKSKITAREAHLSREATLVSNGYEYRGIRCKWMMSTPSSNEKTLHRLDTGAVVRVVAMSDEDSQSVLDFADESDGASTETPPQPHEADSSCTYNLNPPEEKTY